MPKARGDSDRYPFKFVHAAKVAGYRSVADFLDRDALEVEWWMEYALNGPTDLRTQHLLAILIQIVGGALGGKPMQMHKLLPWMNEIHPQPSRRSRGLALSREAVAGMLQEARKNR